MWHVISRNKKLLKEREEEINHKVDIINQDESIQFTKTDILAMIIAAYQLMMPIILILVVILIYLLLFK